MARDVIDGLPYRVEPRSQPADAPALPLPPAPMPGWRSGRPLKRWRYVAAFGEQAMICAGVVHIGPARQAFWAVWDREAQRLHERTRLLGRSRVHVAPGVLRVRDGGVEIDLLLSEEEGVQTVCPNGRDGYVWTRKQAGIPATGTLSLGGAQRELEARAVVDDTAGYHARRTEWWWSAGVGESDDGRALAWNLVAGVNDPPTGSERSVWVDGVAGETPSVRFSPDLDAIESAAGDLRFAAEAQRSRRERLLLVSSEYRQPFGTFAGVLPDGSRLARGLGVMEHHRARW